MTRLRSRGERAARDGGSIREVLLVGSLLVAVVVVMLVVMYRRAYQERFLIMCTSNLKNIHGSVLTYANKQFQFPLAPGPRPRAHESLNVLLAHDAGKGLDGRLFVCPKGDALPAEPSDGPVVLDESSLSYTWVSTETSPFGTPRPLLSDKFYDGFELDGRARRGHDALLTVLRTDGSITTVDADELDPTTGLPPGLTR